MKYLREAGFDVLSLANNHALDAGTEGLSTTLSTLSALHIGTVGAQLELGRFPAWQTTRQGQRIVFLAATQWPPFESGHARVQRAEPAPLCAQVRALARQGTWVVVSLHWGIEGRRDTAPYQRILAHQLIDAGALIVVGHHSHVAGEVENYRGHPIFYSLGNFLWDRMATPQSGLAAQITVTATQPPRASYRITPVVPDEVFRATTSPCTGVTTPTVRTPSRIVRPSAQVPSSSEQPSTPQGETWVQSVSGHFLRGSAHNQWAVWTRRHNGRSFLRLWERATTNWQLVASGAPFDLRRMMAGDIDGDGQDELVTQLYQPSKIEGASQMRLHFYNADTRRGWVPKWRGSHLSRPLLGWDLLSRAGGTGCDLIARERNTRPELGQVEWLTLYRWSGFGLRVLWQIAIEGRITALRCGRDTKGPFVTLSRVQQGSSRAFRLRPTQNDKGEVVLREVAS